MLWSAGAGPSRLYVEMSPHKTIRAHGEPAQHRVEQLAADVVEEDVDALGRELLESRRDILALVVDARVEAEVVDDPRALLGRPRDTDHLGALHLRDLPGDGSHAARGGRDAEGLVRLRLGDLEHADVGGDADVAEYAENIEHIHAFGHHRDGRERVRLHDAVLLPARQVHERARAGTRRSCSSRSRRRRRSIGPLRRSRRRPCSCRARRASRGSSDRCRDSEPRGVPRPRRVAAPEIPSCRSTTR